jgi:hypothetical protein
MGRSMSRSETLDEPLDEPLYETRVELLDDPEHEELDAPLGDAR